jgi:hypothetical protein
VIDRDECPSIQPARPIGLPFCVPFTPAHVMVIGGEPTKIA